MQLFSAISGSILLLLLLYAAGYLLTLWKPACYNALFPRAPHRNLPFLCMGLLTALCFALSCLWYEKGIVGTVLDMLLSGGMCLLALIDYRLKTVPNRILLVLLGLWAAFVSAAVIYDPETGLARLFVSLAGAIIAGTVFLLCYLISGRQLGGGDVKLSFIMGLYLSGSRIMGAITYGVLLCCAFSVIQLLRKKVSAKDGIPLVPFLYLGTMITMVIIG